MSDLVTLTCASCGKSFCRRKAEVNRTLRRGRQSYCGVECASKAIRDKTKFLEYENYCVLCGCPFLVTNRKQRMNKFCSRSCASAGSVTQYRRLTAKTTGKSNSYALSAEQGLRAREAWKYADVTKTLSANKIQHRFEVGICGHVVDLLLTASNHIIEFDSAYHKDPLQRAKDAIRDAKLEYLGYKITRIPTDSACVIPSSVLNEILGVVPESKACERSSFASVRRDGQHIPTSTKHISQVISGRELDSITRSSVGIHAAQSSGAL